MLDADADGLTGGSYPGHDSVGYLGQSGHYTDPETQPIAPGGLLSVGGSYYDMKLGRTLTRGGDINGYKALSNNPASYVDWVGVAQTTIDTVGMVPFLNVPCSVVSAGISAARGEWSGMGLSLLAVVPVEGEGDEALKVARDAKSLEKGVAISNGGEREGESAVSNLNARQRNILSQLSSPSSQAMFHKGNVSMGDLQALTSHTGDEFAMFTLGSRRLIMRGAEGTIPTAMMNETRASEMGSLGWRFSGHTHTSGFAPSPSEGDKAILRAFGQRRSGIWATSGSTREFYGSERDALNARFGIR